MAKTQKRSKLRPVLLLAGLAGGVVAAVRKRGGGDQLTQVANEAASRASDLADRAKEAAPAPVKQVVDKVTKSGDDSDATDTPRYAAPAEAGAQPPAEAGGPPSDDPQATVARSVPADPADLATPSADLSDDVVVPDTSADDPAVREAEAAAAADAGAIGGDPDDRGSQP
jgi:hypothetical protein